MLASKVAKGLLYLVENEDRMVSLRLIGPLSAKHVQVLCQALESNTWTTRLAMDRCAVGDVECAALAQLLSKNRTLTHLSLAGNKITEEGAKALLDAAAPGSLSTLDLSANPTGGEVGDLVRRAVAKRDKLLQDEPSNGGSKAKGAGRLTVTV
mmetsp:Transcript_36919/g.87375  ORF Transcript_36919/g.87375 Transcript_36919/m.87375 type:complete len:153 (-) Transcript_36919:45-503(-)